MRPVDADVLIPLIREEKIKGEILDIIKTLGDGLQAETLNQACDRHIKIISSLPTIDPVKHGEWIKNDGRYGWHCSVCGEDDFYAFVRNSDTGENELQDRYCPNCGARMDGE